MNRPESKHSFSVKTPVGWVRFEESRGKLVAVRFVPSSLPSKSPGAFLEKKVRKWVRRFFDGKFTPPFPWKLLDVSSGTRFQKKVWKQLWKIPQGSVASYKDIARKTGDRRAGRAVGQANNKNPLPLVIPCHRVIGADGTLGGYACGVRLKRKLLRYEGIIV